ncbi:hypothetical protein T4D_2122 [Trichinella pseudospiralis]|uniref:Uncharacterized protein n=1 Tax=Trichinella pseudospiralis TaxID=6337 RepID=A0A0V1FW06_TRIPS|nr:hypothetical protein T4D_2122 [Trichinella pseudospiralis]
MCKFKLQILLASCFDNCSKVTCVACRWLAKQAIYNACLLLILQQEDEEVMKFSCPSTFSIMHFGIFDSVKKVASGRLCISRSISVPGIPSLEAHTACIGLFHFLGRLHIDCYYSTSKPLKLFFFLPFFVGFHCKIRACFFNFG